MPNTDQIRALNDRMRKGDTTVPGRMMLSSGVVDLLQDHDQSPLDLRELVRSYHAFSEDNDPHKEHDFGSFEYLSEKIFWKIDYYGPEGLYGSEDPSDPSKTLRVLTVFLASEY